MTDRLNEQLSACADDELPGREMPLLLERLSRDPDLRARWARYHLIGDAIRDTLPHSLSRSFADRVNAGTAIADPPRRSLARTVAGAAIAASVAVAVLFGLRVDDDGPDPSLVVPVTENPRTVEVARYAVSGGAQWERAQPEVQAQLNAYLLDHSDRVAVSNDTNTDPEQEPDDTQP